MRGPSLKPGDKFGRLTIVRYVGRNQGYECKCACGNLTLARIYSLKNGSHTSCGCKQKEPRNHRRLPNDLGPKREVLRKYKAAANRRGYTWELSENQFISLISGNCHYCGSPPATTRLIYSKDSFDRTLTYNGVDRVDNSKDYRPDNCVSCCSVCNNSKGTLDLEDWKAWVKQVHERMFND